MATFASTLPNPMKWGEIPQMKIYYSRFEIYSKPIHFQSMLIIHGRVETKLKLLKKEWVRVNPGRVFLLHFEPSSYKLKISFPSKSSPNFKGCCVREILFIKYQPIKLFYIFSFALLDSHCVLYF